MASSPSEERTVTGLAVLLQAQPLKQALQPYCVGGPFGRLLDAETERLGEASVQAFETEGLIGAAGRVCGPHLSVPPHRAAASMDARHCSSSTKAGSCSTIRPSPAVREWLKTLRKKNASVIFATQSLSDIDGSAHRAAIIESCPTRVFLPNERAIEPQILSVYRRFGLNDRQIEIIARATPKRDYYCQIRRGNRLFELGLGARGAGLLRRLLKGGPRRHRADFSPNPAARRSPPAWLAATRHRLGRRSHHRSARTMDPHARRSPHEDLPYRSLSLCHGCRGRG